MLTHNSVLKILRQLLKVQMDQLSILLKLVPVDQQLPSVEEEWLHTEDVMGIFKKTRKTIYNWRKAGHLKHKVNGGTCYYLKSDVYARMEKDGAY